MDCRDASRLLQDYAEGRLPGLKRKAFEEHLSACPSCTEELKAYRSLFGSLKRLEREVAPVWLEESVVRNLKLDGIIFVPKVPLARKVAVGLGRAAVYMRYPLAAVFSAIAIYIPVRLIFWAVKGFAGKAALIGSESLVALDQTLEDMSVFSRFFDVVARDARAVKMILGAFFSLLSSSFAGIVLPSLLFVALFTLILIRWLRSPHRRSHDATYTRY